MLFPVEVICYNADPEKKKKVVLLVLVKVKPLLSQVIDKLVLEFSFNIRDQATGT